MHLAGPERVSRVADRLSEHITWPTFYTTLYEQRPDSKIAAEFLLRHGLLSHDEAADLNKKMGKSAGGSKGGGGGKKPKVRTYFYCGVCVAAWTELWPVPCARADAGE